MKKIVGILCGLFTAVAGFGQSQIMVVTANGVRTEYAVTDFGRLVPKFEGGDTTLVVYSQGGAVLQSGARMVSFTILPPEEFEDEEVEVETTSSTAEFSWPKVDGANTYELAVYGDPNLENILTTLTFNREGRLVNEDNTGLRGASEEFRYTVSGLDAASIYYYSIVAKDAVGLDLEVEHGSFNTLSTMTVEQTSESVQVYTRRRTLVVDAPSECDVLFYDTLGRALGISVKTRHAECAVQLQGVYLVRVNGRSYKLLVW